MNLDTNIAMGVRPAPIDFNAMNQGNVLANMAQLRSAENQNALAQYSLATAKRADDSQTALMEKAKVPGFKMTFADAIQGGPAGMAAYKAQEDASTQALTRTKTQKEIDTSTFKLTQDKLKHGWMSMGEASTPQAAIEKLKDGVKKGYFDEPTALKEAQLIMDMTLEQYKQYRIEKIMGLLDAKDQLGAMLPKTVRQDTGSAITSIQDNPMLPGYGKPIAGADITKTQTFADLTAEKQANTSAGQLTLAQKKFAYEKANPGMQYQEGPDGVGYGYNSKTNQMTPVMNAGGTNAIAPAGGANTNALAAPAPAQAVAPAAKPPAAAGGSGPMGVNLPANAAAGVNAPGTPFVGKGEKMTEVQSNAAMFGGAMAQAQNVISELEKKGVVKPNVFAETVKGLAKLSPAFFGTGENAAMTAESAIRQITDSLGGITNDQARLAQAQLSFAVAYLRKTSGAAFGPSEILNTVQEFFPLIGEEAPVMNQKSKSRERAIEGMKISTNSEGKKYISSFQNQAPASNAVTNPSFPGFSIPGTR